MSLTREQIDAIRERWPEVTVRVEHPEIIPGIEGYTMSGGMLGPNFIEAKPNDATLTPVNDAILTPLNDVPGDRQPE